MKDDQLFEVSVITRRTVLVAASSAKEAENITIDFIGDIEETVADEYAYEASPIPYEEALKIWGKDYTPYHNGDEEQVITYFKP